jgi:hypothetical protein
VLSFLLRCFFVLVLLPLTACSGDDTAGGALAFRGEEAFLQGIDYDTGLVPDGSPAQVRIVATGSGGVVVAANGVANGGALAPVPGSGSVQISGMIALRVFAKIDASGITFDDMVHETSYAVPVTTTPFEPFLVGASPVEARADLPPTELARVPIPSVPGGTLVLNLTGGFVSAGFQGTCATAVGGEAQYLGSLALAGELELSATIEIEVPIVGTQTFGPFETAVPIPALDRDLDLGTVAIGSGVRSDSTRSLCDVVPGADGSVPGSDGGTRRDGGGRRDGGPSSCDPGYDDCDGNSANGCETPLDTLTDCGACGAACPDVPNAAGACGGVDCVYSCNADSSDCDASPFTGCEVRHADVADACASPVDAGVFDGDSLCGFGCPSNGDWNEFHRLTGTSSAWFKARANEDSTCGGSIEHRVRLEVPEGIDYDLFVHRPCGTVVGRSIAGRGMDDQVTVSQSDDIARSDAFDYWVEVRYIGGSSCEPWALIFEGHDC